MQETEVLIVGGGATGLTASMLLSASGVRSWLVSKYKHTSSLPKAHLLSIKTMEIFRELGLDARIRQASCPPEHMRYVGWYAGMAGPSADHGRELARMGAHGRGHDDLHWRAASDIGYANLAQARLEPMLRAEAEARAPGGVHFHHAFVSCVEDANGIVATIVDRETDTPYEVRARYLLVCDGGQTVGAQLGVHMEGHAAVATTITVHFDADLSHTRGAAGTDDVLIRSILNPDTGAPGVLVPMGPHAWGSRSREWVFHMIAAHGDHKQEDDATVVDALRRTLGIGALDLHVHQITRWPLNAVVASRFRIGRAFILGDAAHRMPPSGAHGLNTAVQDSYNLCWKLAAVLRGRAGDALLDSYETERRPVARATVDSAYENWQNAWKIAASFGFSPKQSAEENWRNLRLQWADGTQGDAARHRAVQGISTALSTYNHLNVNFGYRYASGALLDDGLPARIPLDKDGDFEPGTKPGHSLPHAWLENTRRRYSINELVGRGRFVLIAGERGDAWCDAARRLAREWDLPLDALTIGVHDGDHLDFRCEWLGHREIGATGAVLVRPDHFIAWRSTDAVDDAYDALARALHQVLSRADDDVRARARSSATSTIMSS
ncbi:FAD-dependent monooxygenase [Pararobbsia silviterrae]|uniref:FAD-binding monooxygenase n=1 Tax=Pararobbsia silviterrae TaxID=1792498 RepID=A0A494XS09_9BURK|nr:FAD-dependent monooxygenase [Pararobbsia silviterrae]RKP50323.1 FAD-binding monooxygenase [Pararobbsia silviterrae]